MLFARILQSVPFATLVPAIGILTLGLLLAIAVGSLTISFAAAPAAGLIVPQITVVAGLAIFAVPLLAVPALLP